jgi:hypothetical protein
MSLTGWLYIGEVLSLIGMGYWLVQAVRHEHPHARQWVIRYACAGGLLAIACIADQLTLPERRLRQSMVLAQREQLIGMRRLGAYAAARWPGAQVLIVASRAHALSSTETDAVIASLREGLGPDLPVVAVEWLSESGAARCVALTMPAVFAMDSDETLIEDFTYLRTRYPEATVIVDLTGLVLVACQMPAASDELHLLLASVALEPDLIDRVMTRGCIDAALVTESSLPMLDDTPSRIIGWQILDRDLWTKLSASCPDPALRP